MKTLAELDLAPLGRLLARVQRRRWVNGVLALTEQWIPLQIAAMCVWVGLAWLLGPRWGWPASTRWLGLAVCVLVPVVAASLVVRSHKPRKYALSLSVDQQIDSGDLLTSAICFAERAEPSALERWVIEMAIERTNGLDPRQLVPLGPTKRIQVALCCLLVLAALPQPDYRQYRASAGLRLPGSDQAGQGTPIQDELSQVRAILSDPRPGVQSDEAKAELEQIERLLDAQARGRLGSDQLQVALASISGRLETAGPATESEFQGLSRALTRHRATEELGKALGKGLGKQARLALEALEKRWRDPKTKLSLEELASLRNAVETERASRQRALASDAAERSRLQAAAEELLRRKREGQLGPDEQPRLDEVSRRLEYLDRRRAAAEQVEPARSALDRAILEAAKELGKQLGLRRDQAFEGFNQARAELERLEQRQQTDAEKRALLEKIQQVSELLRRQNGARQPGSEQDRAVALWRYGQRAQGSSSDGASGADQGRPAAEGHPNPLGSALLMDVVPVPVAHDDRTSSASARSNGGPSTGDRHETELRGSPLGKVLHPDQDVVAVTGDTGSGTVSAEVVRAAAERGFRRQEYREVFRAYAPITESLLTHADVPASDKAQIRHYFQLIQPR